MLSRMCRCRKSSCPIDTIHVKTAPASTVPVAADSVAPTTLEHAVVERPPGHEAELLGADAQRHLRVAPHAVGERDRHLRDASAVLPDAVAELDLEAVALGARARVVGALQDVGPECAKAGGGVADR